MKKTAMRVAAMGIAGVVVALDCAAGTLLVPPTIERNGGGLIGVEEA